MPLKFNTLLEQAGIDPKSVYLLRHQDSGKLSKGTIFSTWVSDRRKFEAFQQIQKWKDRFQPDLFLASFVVAPEGETLFVGVYSVKRLTRILEPFTDPLAGKLPAGDRAWHETERLSTTREYEGRLVVDWGRSRNWRQRASNNNKLVLEIRRQFREETFPGYIRFSRRLENLRNIYSSWRTRLEERKGVYLLAFDDGVQYVGSATGEYGFLQRWENYLRNGHGGNRVLIRDKRDARQAVVSILEIAGSAQTRDDIIKQEMIWKNKLGPKARPLDTE